MKLSDCQSAYRLTPIVQTKLPVRDILNIDLRIDDFTSRCRYYIRMMQFDYIEDTIDYTFVSEAFIKPDKTAIVHTCGSGLPDISRFSDCCPASFDLPVTALLYDLNIGRAQHNLFKNMVAAIIRATTEYVLYYKLPAPLFSAQDMLILHNWVCKTTIDFYRQGLRHRKAYSPVVEKTKVRQVRVS